MTQTEGVEPAPEDWAEEAQPETGPARRCIVTGRIGPKEGLLRFVVSPDGAVVPDMDRRLPGRGIWLSPSRDVVNTAVTKRLFAKAARRAVTVPGDLADVVHALMVRRCLDALSLARRAGQAVCGFEKVKAELKAGRAAVLIEARDAGHDGTGKMRALAPAIPVVEVFDAAELGVPFGRDQAVHVAVAPGGLARRLVQEAGLLTGFREGLVADRQGSAPEQG